MAQGRILLVDDDRRFTAKLASALGGLFTVETCDSAEAFQERFAVGRYDLLIVDMRLPHGREGLDLVRHALRQDPRQAAIVMTAYADTESYADALGSGVLTYLDKREFSPALIARTVQALVEQTALRRQVLTLERRIEASAPADIIGATEAIREIRDLIRSAAESSFAPVVVIGETGTGKKLVAANIHRMSRQRAALPFVIGFCGNQAESSVRESIFGALRTRTGWVDEARGGVLLLDQVSPHDIAVAETLSRCSRERAFHRLGGTEPIEFNLQVIVTLASHAHESDADAAARTNFAAALQGAVIHLPPLRERREDIPLLAQYSLHRLVRDNQTQARAFRAAAMAILEAQHWPGNIRELKTTIDYAAVRADAANVRDIGPEHLPQSVSETPHPARPTQLDYEFQVARAEVALADSTMERFDLNTKTELARTLRYNDRFVFSRRIARHLRHYPILAVDYPRIARLFRVGDADNA